MPPRRANPQRKREKPERYSPSSSDMEDDDSESSSSEAPSASSSSSSSSSSGDERRGVKGDPAAKGEADALHFAELTKRANDYRDAMGKLQTHTKSALENWKSIAQARDEADAHYRELSTALRRHKVLRASAAKNGKGEPPDTLPNEIAQAMENRGTHRVLMRDLGSHARRVARSVKKEQAELFDSSSSEEEESDDSSDADYKLDDDEESEEGEDSGSCSTTE